MNAVKVTYIISSLILQLSLLIGIIFTPIYVTPNWYFWSVFCFLMLLTAASGFTNRLNSWDKMGSM